MEFFHVRGSRICPGSLASAAVVRKRAAAKMTIWKNFTFLTLLVGIAAISIFFANESYAQEQNAPPILYVRDRNWRISETEAIGTVIDRIRAEDPDNDELIFGMEPRFLPGANVDTSGKLPFRIDTSTGTVYLNESLEGRAGENFLIYITVSDGRYTAKTEVFINILGRHDRNINGFGSGSPPSITNLVQNISQFLPSFDQLPGVQSIRNGLPNRRPSFNLPPGIATNGGGSYPFTNFYPNLNNPPRPDLEEENTIFKNEIPTESPSPKTTTPRSRIKLMPISSKTTISPVKPEQEESPSPVTLFTIKSMTIPIAVVICSLIASVAAIFVYLCRRRLCAMSKSLKKKTKEDLAKKSNQSNLSSTLTDDSRNSMVMQQWNGPVAYNNRYVPWERDQQLSNMATSQISTNFGSGGDTCAPGSSAGAVPQNSAAVSSSDQWEFPRHRLKFFNILGEGAFGQVWRCEATDIDGTAGVTTVAVKTLKESAAEIEKKDLLSELEVMKSLEPHVNVVRLLGCCTEKDPTFVIIEYVNCGKLQTYLRNSRAERHYGNTHGKSNFLTSGDLTLFMYQIAKGMDYLTSCGIIHRDLAARNILITDDHMCKIADFGFARDIITSKIYERKSEGKLPIRWMAPESLYDNIFSVKSDIWSFGILMWEIVTLGSTPYPGISAADVMRKVRDGYRLEKPEHCRRELYNIMYYCWSEDANERPGFSEIVEMLDKLLHTEMDYIELERFPDHNYYNIVNLSGEKL